MALADIAAKDADIVVMDLGLTGGSGLDIMSSLVRNHRPVVTMVLTNLSGEVYRETCLSAGATYFFDKTTEFDLALGAIRRIAREHSAGGTG